MENYILQLLADMKKAEQNLPPKLDYKILFPDHPAHDYDMEYMVAWECTPFQTMTELYGIDALAFPPSEKLTDEQIESLTEGIKALWLAFGTDVDVPAGATALQCYKVFTEEWRDATVQYFPPELGGFSSYSFCKYDVESCVWGTFCSCREHLADWERDHEVFQKKYEAGEFDNYQFPLTDFKSRDFGDDELPF
jgi:hypothetical protein